MLGTRTRNANPVIWTWWENENDCAEFAWFLCHSPSKLALDPSTPKDRYRREPSTFEIHLHPSQTLKRVVYSPDLDTNLRNTVDTQIGHLGASNKRPPPPTKERDFPVKKSLMRAQNSGLSAIRSEIGVVEQYTENAEPCGLVASTLFIHPLRKYWRTSVKFTAVPPPGTHSGGMADRYMVLLDSLIHEDRARLGMSRQEKEEWEAVHRHFPRILSMEGKSIQTGNRKIFNTIQRVAERGGEFRWTSCSRPQEHEYVKESVGPDLQTPGRGLLSHGIRPTQNWHLSSAYPSPAMSYSSLPSVYSCDAPSSQERGLLGAKGKVAADPGPSGPEGVYADESEACRLLQQIWSQAVRIDGTFMVLHSGKYQVIGLRHRKSQTLYISRVIEVAEYSEGYNKLQTGLFICALQDALGRARRVEQAQLVTSLENMLISNSTEPCSKSQQKSDLTCAAIPELPKLKSPCSSIPSRRLFTPRSYQQQHDHSPAHVELSNSSAARHLLGSHTSIPDFQQSTNQMSWSRYRMPHMESYEETQPSIFRTPQPKPPPKDKSRKAKTPKPRRSHRDFDSLNRRFPSSEYATSTTYYYQFSDDEDFYEISIAELGRNYRC